MKKYTTCDRFRLTYFVFVVINNLCRGTFSYGTYVVCCVIMLYSYPLPSVYSNIYIHTSILYTIYGHVNNKKMLKIMQNAGSDHSVFGWCRCCRRWWSLRDVGEESVVPIGVIGDCSHGTVRLDQTVLTLHDLTVTFFFLALLVAGVGVVHAIFVGVSWVFVLEKRK